MPRDQEPMVQSGPHANGHGVTTLQDPCPTGVHFERWKNGDDAVFDALHARFSPLLCARIRRHRAYSLLDGAFHVEDVLQEIWARSVPAAKQKFLDAGPGSFLAFLGKIADRTVIDLARRHHAQKRGRGGAESLSTCFDTADTSRPGRSAPPSPTSNARMSELLCLVKEELSAREFESWDLVEMQGFTAEEAGLAMRSTSAAVRGLLLRSRTKLVMRISQDKQAE